MRTPAQVDHEDEDNDDDNDYNDDDDYDYHEDYDNGDDGDGEDESPASRPAWARPCTPAAPARAGSGCTARPPPGPRHHDHDLGWSG